METFIGIIIPFLGTSLGAVFVLFMKKDFNFLVKRGLMGFAAGVMMAASVWSLLIPSMEFSEDMGRLKFIPAVIGFLLGIFFLLLLDNIIPHLHFEGSKAEGIKAKLKKTTMLLFAVTLHNIPEGMAVGVVFAGFLNNNLAVSLSSALALSIGIAIQNIPEGAIISMPLRAEGMKRSKAFIYGVLSGIVEPIGGIITILAIGKVIPLMPYLLSFAAGAMVYVVVEELIPEISLEPHSNIGAVSFALGFAIMMILDTALG